jgi:hypothetical protein
MTPKEKALDLMDSFIQRTRNKWESSMSYKRAKQCSLIAVDEVINSMTVATSVHLPYWQEVKQEIEKL